MKSVFNFSFLVLVLVMNLGCKINQTVVGTAESSDLIYPIFSVSPFSVVESDIDQTYSEAFLVTADKPWNEDILLSVSWQDGYAQSGVDFLFPELSILLPKGEVQVFIPVVVKGDILGEGDEDFTLNISSASLPNFGTLSAQGTIVENDPIVLSVQPLYSVNGANINDFVVNDKAKPLYEQDDTACNAVSSGYYHNCLHGGELRKVVAIGQHSCHQLSLADQLDAFNWECSESEDPVFFYSTGFKQGKGLSSILDALDFKTNKVLLSKNSTLVAESLPLTNWWTNPVVNLALNSMAADPAISLATESTLYTIGASGSSNGISISANKVALVGLNGAILSDTSNRKLDCSNSAGSQPCLVYGQNGSFVWVEGRFQSSQSGLTIVQGGFSATNVDHWRYQNFEVNSTNSTSIGLKIESGQNNFLSNCKVSAGSISIQIYTSHMNYIKDCKIKGGSGGGVTVSATSWYSFFQNVEVANSGSVGIDISGWYATVINSRVYNNGGYGIRSGTANFSSFINNIVTSNGSGGLEASTRDSIVKNTTLANNAGPGLTYFNGFTYSMPVESTVSINNSIGINIPYDGFSGENIYLDANGSGIAISGTSTGGKFSGQLLFGQDNTQDCNVSSTGVNPGLTGVGACSLQGASDALITSGIDGSSFFTGAAGADAFNVHSTGVIGYSSLTDWFSFENEFRVWGREGLFGSSTIRNKCSSAENCRIWDWSMNVSSNLLVNTFGELVDEANCPNSIQGDQTQEYLFGIHHLKHAVEILNDNIGNEDGLCNSNESCIYSPNIGAFQGAGNLMKSCQFQDGVGVNAITGVKILYYQ